MNTDILSFASKLENTEIVEVVQENNYVVANGKVLPPFLRIKPCCARSP